jgi:hypothetical protein
MLYVDGYCLILQACFNYCFVREFMIQDNNYNFFLIPSIITRMDDIKKRTLKKPDIMTLG